MFRNSCIALGITAALLLGGAPRVQAATEGLMGVDGDGSVTETAPALEITQAGSGPGGFNVFDASHMEPIISAMVCWRWLGHDDPTRIDWMAEGGFDYQSRNPEDGDRLARQANAAAIGARFTTYYSMTQMPWYGLYDLPDCAPGEDPFGDNLPEGWLPVDLFLSQVATPEEPAAEDPSGDPAAEEPAAEEVVLPEPEPEPEPVVEEEFPSSTSSTSTSSIEDETPSVTETASATDGGSSDTSTEPERNLEEEVDSALDKLDLATTALDLIEDPAGTAASLLRDEVAPQPSGSDALRNAVKVTPRVSQVAGNTLTGHRKPTAKVKTKQLARPEGGEEFQIEVGKDNWIPVPYPETLQANETMHLWNERQDGGQHVIVIGHGTPKSTYAGMSNHRYEYVLTRTVGVTGSVTWSLESRSAIR